MNRKGFTLIEMIVVITIIVITSVIAIPSIIAYAQQADQLHRTETAKTIYLTAQNQMTQLYALGNLKSAYSGEVSGKYFTTDSNGKYTDELDDTGSMLTDNNVYELLGSTNYPASDLENGQENYVRYLSMPAGSDSTHPLYKLLAPAIRDEKILDDNIVLEYNVLTGKILSVFYSELEEVTEFTYDSTNTSSSGIYGPRAEEYIQIANDRRQGYYGVDYTGTTAPDLVVEASIHLYDGYNDNQSDSLIDDNYLYNKPLYNVGEAAEFTQNILYAEILIRESDLTKAFDLSIVTPDGTSTVVLNNIDLSTFADNETLETAINNFDINGALIFRNDTPINSVVESDFARFVWVLDYVGGDMSSENPDPFKYSITEITGFDVTGTPNPTPIAFDPNGDIFVTIVEDGSSEPALESNQKNPFFATEYDSLNNTVTNVQDLNEVSTARHLNNIRFVTDTDHNYNQIDNIDLAEENGYIELADDVPGEGFAFYDEDDVDNPLNNNWNLVMSPLPELDGKYSGLYTDPVSGDEVVYTINNLHVYNINPNSTATPTADFTDVTGKSIGLFESITDTGEVSHLTFIDPLIEVKNTNSIYGSGPNDGQDKGKYVGIVAGFSTGSINHITVISQSISAPLIDVDDPDVVQYDNNAVIYNDYVGGIVGMVGRTEAPADPDTAVATDYAIHHILYLAAAPHEEITLSTENGIRYENPIVGTNLIVGNNGNPASSSDDMKNYNDATWALNAIHDDSCYYLSGEVVRPYDADPDEDATTPPPQRDNINVDAVTDGLGKPISTNDMYTDMSDTDSDFYKNFLKEVPTDTDTAYNFVNNITNPLDATTISSEEYPYPYYGNYVPNYDKIDQLSADKNLNFTWIIAEFEPFEAEYVYYELYTSSADETLYEPIIGYYSIDSEGNEKHNTLMDTTGTSYRVLSDGYAIKVNRPYTMLESEDITFSINGTEITDEIGTWLYRHNERKRDDELTDMFREDQDSTSIESVLTINNDRFQSYINSTSTDTDQLLLEITDNKIDTPISTYINPLFAKAIYNNDDTAAIDMTYIVRSPRHLDNIGKYNNSLSHLSSYVQELDIEFTNHDTTNALGRTLDKRIYSYANPLTIYTNIKYNTGYVGNFGLESGSLAGTAHAFAGNYNGDGHTIKNLTRSLSAYTYLALFHTTASTAVIENVNIDNFNLRSNGLVRPAAVVGYNAGTVTNVTVNNSTINAYSSTYDVGTPTEGINRPEDVGGAVAINAVTGVVNRVTVSNTDIYRAEVVSPDVYNIRTYGAGGIIGTNNGTLTESGAVNTTVTAVDNFVGGLVGEAGDDSVIEDCYFIYDEQDSTGTPIVPITFERDAVARDGEPLVDTTPRYSIGGISGGTEYNVSVGASYVYNHSKIIDSLYLAPAPSGDDNGIPTDTPTKIYPIVGVESNGYIFATSGGVLSNNIYLSGHYYSSNNINWIEFEYNTLPMDRLAVLGGTYTQFIGAYPSEAISVTNLNSIHGQLAGWQDITPYPLPQGAAAAAAANVPYATNRPSTQITTYDGGTGEVIGDEITATITFNGGNTAIVEPNDTVAVSLKLTDTSGVDIDLARLMKLNINIAEYARYIDITMFEGASPATISFNGTPVAYTLNTTGNANIIEIDTTSMSGLIPANGSVELTFDVTMRDEFIDGSVTVSTLYYYAAMQVEMEMDMLIPDPTNPPDPLETIKLTLTSGKIFIEPIELASSVINNAAPIAANSTFPVTTTIKLADNPINIQFGSLDEHIPAGFSLSGSPQLSIDEGAGPNVVTLNLGSDYTLTTNPDTGTTVLHVMDLELPVGSTLILSYQLKHEGATGGTFEKTSVFVKTVAESEYSKAIAQSSPSWKSVFRVDEPIAPSISTQDSVEPSLQPDEEAEQVVNDEPQDDDETKPNEDDAEPATKPEEGDTPNNDDAPDLEAENEVSDAKDLNAEE